MNAACVVEGCDRPIRAKGMCNAHYIRQRVRGTLALPEPRPVIERILSKLRMDYASGCWEWTGAVGTHGYGVVGAGRREDGTVLVPRFTYEHFIIEIPDGLHIDHLCRNKLCANPWHLDPVTQPVNNARRDAALAEVTR